LATYDGLPAQSPLAALAEFVAYECQASEVARRLVGIPRRTRSLGASPLVTVE
jgi:hypothetical protein